VDSEAYLLQISKQVYNSQKLIAKWVSRKHRPQKRRPQTAGLKNTDLENADLENTDHENTDLENEDLENVVCVLIEKLRFFIKSMGKRRFKRAHNYHQDRFLSLLIN